MGRTITCSNSVLLIFPDNNLVKAPGICAIHQLLPEAVIFQQSGQTRKCLQVYPGGIFRCDQKKKKVHRPAINRVEFNPARAFSKHGKQFF